MLAFLKESLLHLFFPHVCEGCGTDILQTDQLLCLRCSSHLPRTRFEFFPNNPVEKTFWGRIPVEAAAAHLYFSKDGLVQHLLHQLKYRDNKDAGIHLGRMLGLALQESNRFHCDAIIPLPLHPKRERQRGYNQAAVIATGVSGITGWPVLKEVVIRPAYTETQTKKGRLERWQNIGGKFKLIHPDAIRDKHILLLDDVITTGATLEACGEELLKGGCRVSVGAVAYASKL